MEELIKILEQFEENRSKECHKASWNEEAVAECFESCAREILCGGYFRINGKHILNKRILDIGSIELYYHEEEGKIKDPIMYHTNDKGSYSKFYDKTKGLPYFKFGSFNLHTSGVDVTFENPNEKYRASFLIRSYRMLDNENQLNDDSIDFDSCSTHIFDDMFPEGIFLGNHDFEIKWKQYTKEKEFESCKRINVAEYKKDETGNYLKNKNGKYEKEDPVVFPDSKAIDNNLFFQSGKHYYKRETRNWGFKRVSTKKVK